MKRFVWPAMLAALAIAMIIAVSPGGKDSPRTPEQRIASLSSQIRCPTCAGLSVGESDASLARSSKEEIARRVNAGESDQQIRAYFVSRYGDSALMSPERKGIARLPWILPIALGLALLTLVTFAVRRWRSNANVTPTDDDRSLVDAALRGRA